ncbi:MAG TPA: EamA family transporter, partial [Thermoanaerobaculia bacterium]|nr:EamA family transporter [Thermoanaerobaculia bacterium]
MPPPHPRRALAVVFALLTVAVWGVNYPAMKVALREMHPLAYTGWRFVLAAGLLLAEAAARREPALPPRRVWGLAALLAVACLGLALAFLVFAEGVLLARTLAERHGESVDPAVELRALGAANVAANIAALGGNSKFASMRGAR